MITTVRECGGWGKSPLSKTHVGKPQTSGAPIGICSVPTVWLQIQDLCWLRALCVPKPVFRHLESPWWWEHESALQNPILCYMEPPAKTGFSQEGHLYPQGFTHTRVCPKLCGKWNCLSILGQTFEIQQSFSEHSFPINFLKTCKKIL